jgi:hypothetical protein
MFNNPADGPGGWPNAQDGNQYVAIASSIFPPTPGFSTLSQIFNISVAGDYVLGWYDNAFSGVGGTPYSVSIVPNGLGLPVSQTISFPLGASSWGSHSLSTTLAAGNYTLIFKADATGVGRTLLDNVSLDAAASTSVPETGSTAGLLGLAFGGIAFCERKRFTVQSGFTV